MRVLYAVAALSVASAASAQDAGQGQFESTCAACHQVNGQGIKGAFPALAGDPFVLGAPQPVITTVLNGRGGMPAWKADLTDAQIASAITYVRSAWGNKATPVSEAMVATERAKSAAPPPAPLQSH